MLGGYGWGTHGRLQTGRVRVGPERAEVQSEDVRVERGRMKEDIIGGRHMAKG